MAPFFFIIRPFLASASQDGQVAQLVEQRTENPCVAGSIPALATTPQYNHEVMSLFALGLNHHTAPLAMRERVVFHVERLQDALTELKSAFSPEAAILSTCNRTELYIGGDTSPERGANLSDWLARYHHM